MTKRWMAVKVFYFYHIGKCGGTFVDRNLGQIASELSASYHSFMSLAGPGQPPSRHNQRLLTSFLELLPSVNQEFLFLHHHHRFPGMKEMLPAIQECSRSLKQQGDKLYLFTSVREPISRLTSYVNYWNQTHDASEAKNFSGYMPNNQQSKYLLYNSAAWGNSKPAPKKAEIKPILDFMDGVYTTDNFQNLENDLRMWIGKEFRWDTSRLNVSKKTMLPTDEEKKQYLEQNEMDVWMYQYAASLASQKY